MSVAIYGLFDRSRQQLVYIGQSVVPETRFVYHKKHTVRHIREHVEMFILEAVPKPLADETEMWWLDYARFIGCSLLNRVYNHTRLSPPPQGRDKVVTVQLMGLQQIMETAKAGGVVSSDEDAARRAGISLNTFRTAKTGVSVSVSTGNKIAKALHVKLAELQSLPIAGSQQ